MGNFLPKLTNFYFKIDDYCSKNVYWSRKCDFDSKIAFLGGNGAFQLGKLSTNYVTYQKIWYRNCSEARYSRGYKGYPRPHFLSIHKVWFRSCSDLGDWIDWEKPLIQFIHAEYWIFTKNTKNVAMMDKFGSKIPQKSIIPYLKPKASEFNMDPWIPYQTWFKLATL